MLQSFVAVEQVRAVQPLHVAMLMATNMCLPYSGSVTGTSTSKQYTIIGLTLSVLIERGFFFFYSWCRLRIHA